MMFIWRLVLILLILTIIRWMLAKVLRPAATRPRMRQPGALQPKSGRMVKDPQCGMYVAANLAVVAQNRDKTLYFCSSECRDNYAKGTLERRNS